MLPLKRVEPAETSVLESILDPNRHQSGTLATVRFMRVIATLLAVLSLSLLLISCDTSSPGGSGQAQGGQAGDGHAQETTQALNATVVALQTALALNQQGAGSAGNGQSNQGNGGVQATAPAIASLPPSPTPQQPSQPTPTQPPPATVAPAPTSAPDTATTVPVPQPSPTSEATAPSTVLEVGQTWKQGGLEVKLTSAELGTDNVTVHFLLTNRRASDIIVRYSAENIAATDNANNKLQIEFDRYNLAKNGAFTHVLPKGESYMLVENEGGPSIRLKVDAGDPSITEVQVAVTGISSIQEARWRIPINH